jgi:hypothetical protein
MCFCLNHSDGLLVLDTTAEKSEETEQDSNLKY